MDLNRIPLLLEGHDARVKRRMKQWEKAHSKLNAITIAGYRKVAKQTANWDARLAGETSEQHARRLAASSDIDDHIHDQVVNRPKYRERLDKAKDREASRRAALEKAEAARDENRRRKRLLAAPVPSLDSTEVRTTDAISRTFQSAPKRVKKIAIVRKV